MLLGVTAPLAAYPAAKPTIQTYALADSVRAKLSTESANRNSSLRRLVGHANLYDIILDVLHDVEQGSQQLFDSEDDEDEDDEDNDNDDVEDETNRRLADDWAVAHTTISTVKLEEAKATQIAIATTTICVAFGDEPPVPMRDAPAVCVAEMACDEDDAEDDEMEMDITESVVRKSSLPSLCYSCETEDEDDQESSSDGESDDYFRGFATVQGAEVCVAALVDVGKKR